MDEDAIVASPPFRVRHHFFDPHFDRPLTMKASDTIAIELGERAPDWALEDRRTYLTQQFSYRDALEAFSRAVILEKASDRDAAFAQTFEALGHVIHLLQDVGSPEHARNDFHLPLGSNRSLFEQHLDEATVMPSLKYGGYLPPDFETAREFWVSPLRDGSGLAEFSNRNFVSADTNFSVSNADPPIGGEYPSPVRDDSTAHDVDVQSLSAVPLRDRWGRLLEGKVTFYGAPVVDAVTGGTEFNDRLTTLSYFGRDLASKGEERLFTINRFNVERHAEFLVPRAVGYSAGLLNHFFRGRLESTFGDDPADPTGALLTVINRSPEAIGPGTLGVYVDDPEGARRPVGAAEIRTAVGPDAALPPIKVSGALETQAGAVAYRGPMGTEPDAVIGKVFAAAEVEQIFRGAADWMLRTQQGLYPLGLGLGPADVRWGDRDNTLVSRTDEGGSAISFSAYRINRLEGTKAVPLRGDGKVDLVPVGSARLGGEPISLGTTIDYRNITHFSQGLATVERHVTESHGADGTLTIDVKIGAVTVETIGARDYVLARTIPLILTDAQPADRSYSWSVTDFFLSKDSEVLLLVQAVLGSAPGFLVPMLRHSYDGELVLDPFDDTFINQIAPPEANPIFVVNLSRRTVAAKTCDDVVRIVWERTERDNALEYYSIDDFDGVVTAGYVPVRGSAPAGPSDPILFDLESAVGISRITLEGLYRSELLDAGFLQFQLVEERTVSASALPDRVEGHQPAFRLTDVRYRQSPSPFVLTEARRASAADNAYALLGLKEDAGVSGPSVRRWQVLQWTPQRGRAIARTMPELLNSRSFLYLRGAHRAATLALENGRDPLDGRFKDRTHFITLEPPVTLAGDATGAYRLLQPALAYSVTDQQFHRIGPALAPLGTPPPLAPGGSEQGAYHVVGRR